MRYLLAIGLLGTHLFFHVAHADAQIAPRYRATRLDPGLDVDVYASAINVNGLVVGGFGGPVHAFIWRDGVFTDLGAVAPRDVSTAYGVNDSGTLAGALLLTAVDAVPATWSESTGWRILPRFGLISLATSISNSNVVVGWGWDASGIAHAIRYEGQSWIDLGVGQANAINADGVVAGSAVWESSGEPTVWMPDGTRLRLGRPGNAWAVNGLGQVVGDLEISVRPEAFHPFFWDPRLGVTDLGTLGGASGSARAIHNAIVVGWAQTGTGEKRAFIYEHAPGAQLEDLNLLTADLDGWVLFEGVAINAVGQIVATGSKAGRTTAFLLTPEYVTPQRPVTISNLSASPAVLWPPNHKLKSVSLQYTATDYAGGPARCTPSVASEPDDDIENNVVVQDAFSLLLRAEKAKRGDRRYSITIRCADAAGNAAEATTFVTVPHDRGR